MCRCGKFLPSKNKNIYNRKKLNLKLSSEKNENSNFINILPSNSCHLKLQNFERFVAEKKKFLEEPELKFLRVSEISSNQKTNKVSKKKKWRNFFIKTRKTEKNQSRRGLAWSHKNWELTKKFTEKSSPTLIDCRVECWLCFVWVFGKKIRKSWDISRSKNNKKRKISK